MAVLRPTSVEFIGGVSLPNGGANGFVVSNATRFLPVGVSAERTEAVGGTLTIATEAAVETAVPYACHISHLAVAVSTAPGTSESHAFTVRKNGSDTAVVATVSGTARVANDATNTVTFAAGDRLCVKVIGSTSAAGSASGGLTFRVRKA